MVRFSVFLFALVALAAPRRPFSHKYHLTQVTACENCHTAAAESTRAGDNLIPDKSACVTCHDEVEITGPRQIGVQVFNHAKHVKAGNIASTIAAAIKDGAYLGAAPPTPESLNAAKDVCSACHRGISESENVPHDKVAKAHFPQMADCLVCHNTINPPQSCKQCHNGSAANLRPFSHVDGFRDKHSDKAVAKTGCAACHGKKVKCGDCH